MRMTFFFKLNELHCHFSISSICEDTFKKKIKRIKKERFHICIYISACCFVCTHKTRVRYVECAIIQFSRVVFCISAKDAWFYIVSYLYVCGYNILFYFYYIVVQKKHMSGSKSTSPFMYNWKVFQF